MQAQIAVPYQQIAEFCQRHHIRKLALFGSVLTDKFRADSDVDALAAFEPGREPTLAELLTMERELGVLMGRSVDLGEQASVEEDPNYIRREVILSALLTIYEK